MPKARNGEVELEYETFGPPDGRPLLLISGMVAQLTRYPVAFGEALVDAGFQAIRFDNRDVGLSTRLIGVPAPSLLGGLLRPSSAPYSLPDMADDAVAVLEAAGWASAHVLGTSMDGFVAQLVAIEHPGRVRSLISVSSTPDPRLGGLPKPSVFRRTDRIIKTAETSREQAEAWAVEMFRLVGSPGGLVGSPGDLFDEAGVRETARLSYERSPATREGNLRQRAATSSSSRNPPGAVPPEHPGPGPARRPGRDDEPARGPGDGRGDPRRPAGEVPGHGPRPAPVARDDLRDPPDRRELSGTARQAPRRDRRRREGAGRPDCRGGATHRRHTSEARPWRWGHPRR